MPPRQIKRHRFNPSGRNYIPGVLLAPAEELQGVSAADLLAVLFAYIIEHFVEHFGLFPEVRAVMAEVAPDHSLRPVGVVDLPDRGLDRQALRVRILHEDAR